MGNLKCFYKNQNHFFFSKNSLRNTIRVSHSLDPILLDLNWVQTGCKVISIQDWEVELNNC